MLRSKKGTPYPPIRSSPLVPPFSLLKLLYRLVINLIESPVQTFQRNTLAAHSMLRTFTHHVIAVALGCKIALATVFCLAALHKNNAGLGEPLNRMNDAYPRHSNSGRDGVLLDPSPAGSAACQKQKQRSALGASFSAQNERDVRLRENAVLRASACKTIAVRPLQNSLDVLQHLGFTGSYQGLILTAIPVCQLCAASVSGVSRSSGGNRHPHHCLMPGSGSGEWCANFGLLYETGKGIKAFILPCSRICRKCFGNLMESLRRNGLDAQNIAHILDGHKRLPIHIPAYGSRDRMPGEGQLYRLSKARPKFNPPTGFSRKSEHGSVESEQLFR